MNKWTNLIEIADITTGFPFKGEKYSATGIRTVRGENVTEGRLRWDTIKCWNEPFEQEENYLLEKDDIVIGMDGSKVGKNKARIREDDLPLLLAQRVACVRAKKGNDQIYLYYLIDNPRFEKYVFKTQTGSSVPHISKKQIEDFKVPIFDLPTQQKIASVLSALDDKIEVNNKINAELEQMAKTLYDYWFVQFDFPNEEGKPYKSSDGKMVYKEVLKREIPEGWENAELRDYLEVNRGVSYAGKDIVSNGVPMINLNSFNINGTFKPEGTKFFSGEYGVNKILKAFDLVMCNTQQTVLDPQKDIIGKSFLVPDIFEKDVISSHHVTTLRVKDGNLKFYLNSLFNTVHFHRYISGYATGTNILGLNLDGLLSYQTQIPSSKLLSRFKDIISNIEKKKSGIIKQNQELVQLRDWLLPMLMNGQVKVGDNYNIDSDAILIAAEPDVCYGDTEHLDIPSNRKGFARQVLAGKVVSVFKYDPNFSHIKFQKVQFLAEHIIEADLNQNYYYQAAGPYDNAFMKSIYGHFKTQKWFDSQNQRFVPLTKKEKIEGYYQGYFAPVQDRLDRLFNLLYQTTEAEAEIIATIYAVWNNRIIQRTSISDSELIEDFYKWSDRKQQYARGQILVGLKWLRDNNLEPKGFGKLIKKAKNIK